MCIRDSAGIGQVDVEEPADESDVRAVPVVGFGQRAVDVEFDEDAADIPDVYKRQVLVVGFAALVLAAEPGELVAAEWRGVVALAEAVDGRCV